MHSGWLQQHRIETLEQVQLHLTRQQEQTMKQKDCWQRQLTTAKRQRQTNCRCQRSLGKATVR